MQMITGTPNSQGHSLGDPYLQCKLLWNQRKSKQLFLLSPSEKETWKTLLRRYLDNYLIIELPTFVCGMSINQVFKALNDPTRRKILDMLRESDLTAGEIAEAFDMSKPSVSHHLDQLRQADLVLSEKKGQYVLYSLHTTVLDDLMSWLISLQSPVSTPKTSKS